MQVAVIAASCCVGHICMVGSGGGCSFMLLHPVPTSAAAGLTFAPCVLTFAPCVLTFAPCVLTFAPSVLTFGRCACGVSLLSTGANILLAQVVVVTSCNLR